MDDNFVIVCVATPDYLDIWRDCISSHERYAHKHGLSYDFISTVQMHPKWEKLRIAHRHLSHGKDVLLIDADAEFTGNAPDTRQVLRQQPSGQIFCVVGTSGRPNSGVLIMRGGEDSAATRLLQRCLAYQNVRMRGSDLVTVEGENGHIIRFLRDPDIKQSVVHLPQKWNNTERPSPRDYIRHYAGPMKSAYGRGLVSAWIRLSVASTKKQIRRALSHAVTQGINGLERTKTGRRVFNFSDNVRKPSRREFRELRRIAFDELMDYGNGRVIGGLYRGMRLEDEGSWGGPNPAYVLGCYEKEVQNVLRSREWKHTTAIVDIGCGNGFHAIGLALVTPAIRVIACDTDQGARHATAALAKLNDIDRRVLVCADTEFEGVSNEELERPLIIVDVEGDETLLVPELYKKAPRADLLVEVHDRGVHDIRGFLKELLQSTHDYEFVSRQGRCPSDAPVLADWSDNAAWLSLSEGRSNSDGWMYFKFREDPHGAGKG